MVGTYTLEYYKKGLETLLWAPPPVCLPSLRHITVQNLPGLPPPFLYTVSDQKLDGEKVWEQGYPCLQVQVCIYMYGDPYLWDGCIEP